MACAMGVARESQGCRFAMGVRRNSKVEGSNPGQEKKMEKSRFHNFKKIYSTIHPIQRHFRKKAFLCEASAF
jgi:hypothetical protein